MERLPAVVRRSPVLALALLLAAGCASVHGRAAPDTIWLGGPILTMDDAAPEVEALAVRGGRIVARGARADVEALRGPSTRVVDLEGRALLPGFVDSHGHFAQVGLQASAANLLPPPDGEGRTIADLQRLLREHMASSSMVREHGFLLGMNYDDSQLAEQRHPTRADLDAVSTEIPVVVVHQSGHLGGYNSVALERAGIGPESQDPPGGAIRREADGRTPDGVLEENAHFAALLALVPRFSTDERMAMVAAAQDIYAANGYTTVQEGRADPGTLATLTAAGERGMLALDVVVYPDLDMNADNEALHGPLVSRSYHDRVRIGGIKLTLDGSPQGKTAWFTRGYLEPPAGQPADYRGYPSLTAEETRERIQRAYENGWQVLVHANGDAAIDQLIASVRAAAAAVPGTDRRTVLIHGQFTRRDQVDALVELGVFPSLFPMHTFYWGDWHRASVAGEERARDISPTGWFLARGVPFGIHHDAPVTFPNSMRILDSAVNRTTRSGFVLGPEQRLDPVVALKAMTIWPAFQHFEEHEKGSLEIGKLADLVVLSADPRRAERAQLVDLRVVETVKEGKTVFRVRASGPGR